MEQENPGRNLELAMQAGRDRRYIDAVTLLTQVLRETDEYPEAVLYLGRSYHALGQLSRAASALTLFVRRNPRVSAGHFFLGRTLLCLGHLPAGLRHLKRCLKLRPGFAPALSMAGVAYLRARNPEKATELLEQAVTVDPENTRIFNAYLNALLTLGIKTFRRGQLVESGQIFQFILRHREDSVSAHVYLARVFTELDRGAVALTHFEAASRLSPQDASLKLHMAVLQLQLGNTSEALRELHAAAGSVDDQEFLQSDPVQLARLLAVSHFESGKYRQAVFYGKKVLKQDYHEAQIHVILAESFRALGDLTKARNHYDRALESDRGNTDLLAGRAMVLYQAGEYREMLRVLDRLARSESQRTLAEYYRALCMSHLQEDPAQTVALLQNAIRARGPDPHLMDALGRDYLRLDLPDLAESWLLRALRMDPKNRGAMEALIAAYGELDRHDDLIRAYASLLEAYPSEHQVRKDFVRCLLSGDAYAQAATELEILIPLEPANRTLRRLLASCHRKTGRYADALLLLKDMLRADPNSEDDLKSLLYCMDRLGDRTRAVQLLRAALPRFRGSTALRMILGILLLKQNDLEPAGTIFRDVVGDNPNEWVAYQNLGYIHKRMGDDAFAERFFTRAKDIKARLKG